MGELNEESDDSDEAGPRLIFFVGCDKAPTKKVSGEDAASCQAETLFSPSLFLFKLFAGLCHELTLAGRVHTTRRAGQDCQPNRAINKTSFVKKGSY